MQKTRLDVFKESSERVARYRQAMRLLKEAGIEEILLELSQPEHIPTAHPSAGNAAIAALYDSIGYRRCLEELFSLDELVARKQIPLVMDFGASEKMGLTPDEMKEYATQ